MRFLLFCLMIFPLLGSADEQNPEVLKETKRIAVVFTGATNDISASSFGHIALRFSPSEKSSLLDYVVEFVANVPTGENPAKKYAKGIGLPGFSYNVVRNINSFVNFRNSNQLIEDRDVDIIELDLTQDQIDKMVDYVINYKEHLPQMEYTFTVKNCAYFSFLFIEKAIGKEISQKSRPWMAEELLNELGVVKEVISYPRGSIERERVARNSFEKFGIDEYFPSEDWKDSYLRMIKQEDYHLKMSAYLKLLTVYGSSSTPKKVKRNITSLMRATKKFEINAYDFVLGEFFKDASKKLVLTLSSQSYGLKLNTGIKNSIEHEIKAENGKIYIDVKLSRRLGATSNSIVKNKVKRLRFEIPDVKFDPVTRSLSYKGIHIGRHIKTKKLDFILTQRLDYGLDINENKQTVTAMIYIDPTKNIKSAKLSYEELLESGPIALDNMKDFKGTGGTCRALVLLQKALTERVIFLPDGEFGSDIDKIELLSKVYKGSYAVVSGYKGIKDFTASIDKEKLIEFVTKLQYEKINMSMQEQVLENVEHQTEFKKDTFYNIKAILDEGLLLPIDIGRYYKGTWMWAKNVGHSLLIYGIKENGDGRYKVTAYDPNYGVINRLYKVNDKFMLEHVLLSNEFDYRAAVPKLERYDLELDHAIRSRHIDDQGLKFLLDKGKATQIVPRSSAHKLLK